MKKNFNLVLLAISLVFISCDKEFNTVGSDLVGDEHFDYSVDQNTEIKAYTVATGEVQTNNLPINPLGIYRNDVFGTTAASFVTQAGLSIGNPDFGTNVQVENVVLYVPFFSQVESTDTDGNSTYKLDSIYSNNFDVDEDLSQLENKKFKLSVYESGYFLQNAQPNGDLQKYYSDLTAEIESLKRGNDGSGNSILGGARLNDSPDVSQNDLFYFNKNEIKIYERKLNGSGNYVYVDALGNEIADQSDVSQRVVKERLAPGIYLELNREYFKNRILNASESNLFNNNSFRDYFRGLYFKVEEIPGVEAAMAVLNFNNAKLNINYNSISSGSTTATSKTYKINMGTGSGSNTVSLFQENFKQSFIDHLNLPQNDYTSASNPLLGANEKLYLKGGNGSIVYIDLFGPDNDGDQIADQLEVYRSKKWMINDAYIEFYVDKSIMDPLKKSEEPLRLYLFDATNQKTLIDYTADPTTNSNVKLNKNTFGGVINRENTQNGVKYKIRITNLINNIFNSDNENLNKNIKLGLCVTETINVASNFYFKNSKNIGGQEIKYFPVSSIMSSTGTVIHGPNSLDVDKRLKLTIHYTKPD